MGGTRQVIEAESYGFCEEKATGGGVTLGDWTAGFEGL